MSDKLMFVEVRGKEKTWCFSFYGDPKYLPEWRDDGLEVRLVEYSVPMSLPRFVPVQLWCFLQDVFNFRNPWRK